MTLLTKGEEGHFTLNLLENMTNRFPQIPDFAWISNALPLKEVPCQFGRDRINNGACSFEKHKHEY